MRPKKQLPPTAQKNLDAVARFEQQLMLKRSWSERLGESISYFFGSMYFVLVQVVLIGGWIAWNLSHVTTPAQLARRTIFDAYPFPLLSLAVDVEFILLTTFVLMNQKHQARREEHWAHLHLQLSLLTEQEVTKNLQLIAVIAEHLGVKNGQDDRQLDELAKPTSMKAMVDAIAAARAPNVSGSDTPAAKESQSKT